MLCSSGRLGGGLPGFQRVPLAATSLCQEDFAAPCLPACPWLQPAMRGGSQSAVEAASLLGRGRAPAWAGRRETPAAGDLGQVTSPLSPSGCLSAGWGDSGSLPESGGAVWGARFPAAFVRKCPVVCRDGAPCSWWAGGLALCFHGCAWFSSAPPSHFCLLLVPRLALLLGLGVSGCTCIEAHLAETLPPCRPSDLGHPGAGRDRVHFLIIALQYQALCCSL